MEEKVEISLERYEKMREKEREFNQLVKEMETLKETTKAEVGEVVFHILKFSQLVLESLRNNGPQIEEALHTAAKDAGFTASFDVYGHEGIVGVGSGKIYKIIK